MRVVEAKLNQRTAESISSRVGFDGYAAQAPSRVVLRSRERFAADRRDGDDAHCVVHGDMQRRWFVVAAKATAFGLIVEQDRASQRQDMFS